ncbi:hypothetical protein FA15DRAFT_760241 [Coprinopsis marcescibilis]|uniref:F-box domain-containing protein n=1 Tax=Coprinopsis marcescibilis TaxID=230819 RepID=A0A5C3KG41_COPMA|nr:hypothetical protein FA15DRAFT_760241 [Coprinopsis marcescibilis]
MSVSPSLSATSLVSLLSLNNDPLNPAQEQCLRAEVASIDESLKQLDHEIRDVYVQFQSLRSKWYRLVEKKKPYTKILSHWRSLPSEILIEIFKLVICSDDDGETSEKDGLTQLPAIAGVCRRWAQVIYGTPSLWSEVEVRERRKAANMKDLVRSLKNHYSRCGPCPWSFSFSSDRLLPSAAPATSSRATSPLVEFLMKSSRWKSISLSHPNLDILAPLFSTDPTHLRYSWPELVSLSLKGWYYTPSRVAPFADTNEPVPVYMGSTPRLTSLSLQTCDQRISNWELPWHQLTTLRLTTADSYASYIRIVQNCRNLEVCDLSFPPSANPLSSVCELDGISKTKTHLPRLKLLNISHSDSTVIWPFFAGLTAPCLYELSVSAPPIPGRALPKKDTSTGKTLSAFLARSKCNILYLTFKNLPLKDDDYLSIIKHTPNVLSLQITDHVCAGYWIDAMNKLDLLQRMREFVLFGNLERKRPVSEFLIDFLDRRGGLEYDGDKLFYGDEVTFRDEMFTWSFKVQKEDDDREVIW